MTRAGPGSSTYDYIIVGAGSAGCVLANRLSQDPDVSVLLLEAGGRGRHMMMRIPAGFSRLQKTAVDWGFLTVPQRHLNDRRLTFPLGKTLGGSSAINGMIYIRGQKEDYDSWAADGSPGWSYDEVLPYFRRAENNEMLGGHYHGTDGPLSISNQRSPNILARAYILAAQQAGHKFNADFNGESQLGANLYQVTQKDGRRASAATSYLLPAMARTEFDRRAECLHPQAHRRGPPRRRRRIFGRGSAPDRAVRPRGAAERRRGRVAQAADALRHRAGG